MSFHGPDRFKTPKAFWAGLEKIGLTPAAVLREARLPMTIYGERALVTTAQFFALWRAAGGLSSDPGAGLKLAQVDPGVLPPSSVAAFYARDYRDALNRTARFKQLCTPEVMHVTESKKSEDSKDECVIELEWPHAEEETPPLLTDAAFAFFVELGRRGTGQPVQPKRLELKRPPEPTGAHKAYFNCQVKFRARRDALVLNAADLEQPFLSYNAELLEMLNTQLLNVMDERQALASLREQVKWILKRLLAGSRPDIPAVAQELGLSQRTLQRRIVEEGASFRQILLEARQELVRQYLTQPEMQINEVAYLLGYEDSNSFYRAFRTWEGTTPAHWRTGLRNTKSGQQPSKPWSVAVA